jgi:short-subunit dehydrogenase
MWNLSGDDIERAKEELKSRRAAIQARYDNEMRQLEADLADLKSFERLAVKLVPRFKGEDRARA